MNLSEAGASGASVMARYAREAAAAAGIIVAIAGSAPAQASPGSAEGKQLAAEQTGYLPATDLQAKQNATAIHLGRFAAAKRQTPKSLPKKPVATITGEQRFLGAAVSTLTWNPLIKQTFVNRFDSLTPENELKMDSTQPRPGVFNFAPADQLVNFALENGKRVRGHALLFPKQDPYYIQRFAKSCNRSAMIGIMYHHIGTVMNHFKSRVHEWDVVNEAVDENNPWQKCIGPEYVEMAFRKAHQVDPAADLYLNEFNAELPAVDGQPNPRHKKLQDIVNRLLANNVPLHGIGLQTHARPETYLDQMKAFGETIDTYTRKGLKVQLTELDVTLPQFSQDSKDIRAQAATYRGFAKVCGRRPGCVGVTTWGVNDRVSWLATGSPLLIDASNNPKDVLPVVRRWLTHTPSPRLTRTYALENKPATTTTSTANIGR